MNASTTDDATAHGFLADLRVQRWDDHRFYHHSRINQSLHFLSAMSFLAAYVTALTSPAAAAGIAWLVSMTSRQAGHFFFEPKGYDHVNEATHEHKEEIKVGYNLTRKVVLMTVWALSPLLFLLSPTAFGLCRPHAGWGEFARHVGVLWFAVGIGGLLFRTVQLFFVRAIRTGWVWATKIVTDPFLDVKLYWRAPFALLRGELIDQGLRAEVEAHGRVQ